MARSSADDGELKRACEAAIEGSKQKVVLSIRVAKSRGIFGKSAKLGRQMAKARVLAITTKSKGRQKTKAFLRVLKYSTGGILEPAKLYKLKHLSKVEIVQNDPSCCTFMLGFDNLRNQSVAPPHWTMRNKDDRDVLGHLPKVVGMDIVEMALWAKDNSHKTSNEMSFEDGDATSAVIKSETKVTVEKDLLSQAKEEDMQILLDTYIMGVGEADAFSEKMKLELHALETTNVLALLESETLLNEVLQGLEGATICVEDMDEWLGIFNTKLLHMQEDIESIEARNNNLELHFVNNKALIVELDALLERFHISYEFAATLTDGKFDESLLGKSIEACEWLIAALQHLQVLNLDPSYASMQAVKEKQTELEKLKGVFVRHASEFLRNYFASLVDCIINEKSTISKRGLLKKPDHADLRRKCRVYAPLLQILKKLDKNNLSLLRKAYCHSLNLLLRKEAHEYANELRTGTKIGTAHISWFESSASTCQPASSAETAVLSEAYSKMLTSFIPLLIEENCFFADLMCFDVSAMANDNNGRHGNEQEGSSTVELNEYLQELLDGIQEDFYALLDWSFKLDPLRCISMHGITELYLSDHKVETTGIVGLLLDGLETRISINFGKFVDDCIFMIEKTERNARQLGVLPYIPRFALLATRMEIYIHGQSRDLVDQAYTKIVSIMLVCLERTAQMDPKYSDIVLLENYAAFQKSLYDLANVVSTLAKFYHQASELYDQACTRHVNMVIFITFEKLFLFARRIEELMLSIVPEEIQFQIGMSKMDLRKMLKSSLSGLEKTINAMYKKLQKNLISEELLPSLWEKCKKDFLDKYDSFVRLVNKIYPGESIPQMVELRDLVAQM